MNAPRKIAKEYKVNDDSKVVLTVLVGDGQHADPVVMLDGTLLKIGNITDLPIGTGSAIKGKTLYIKSVVNDVNPKTNHTSLVYVLTGGPDAVHDINEGNITND